MKRQIIAGLAVAGALTLWVGASAFASDDPAETLLQQAGAAADAASAQVSACAEAKLATFENTQANADSDAAEQAVETASETVSNIAETAQQKIDAELESFSDRVDNADEDGATLPTAADLATFTMTVNGFATDACNAINAVTVGPTVTPPAETENDTERDSGSSD